VTWFFEALPTKPISEELHLQTQLKFMPKIMRWSQTSRLLLALSLFGLPMIGRSQWVAFNDHAATNTTHANATRWNVFGTLNGAPGASGPLKNITSGANLSAVLTISNFGAAAEGAFGPLQPGNPTYSVFNGFVDFGGTPNPSVGLTGGNVVTYTFSGLDPSKKYNFKGTAVRGNAPYTDRWTLIEITNAVSAVAAHTANVLTSNQVPAIPPTQCAVNTGYNSDPSSGDYASWDQIQPSASGTFSVISRLYSGTVPGGSSGGNKGYAITGVRLEELSAAPTPIAIIAQPISRSVNVPTSVTLSVSVSGSSPSYQWYKNGSVFAGKTNSFIQFNPSAVPDSGDYFVIVSNSVNSVTSQVATLRLASRRSFTIIWV